VARNPTTSSTTAQTFELIFERLIKATIEADADYIAASKPNEFNLYCSHESAGGKPPCAVVAVVRRENVFDDDALWECGVGIELRLPPNEEGFSEELFAAIAQSVERLTLIAALNTSTTVCPTGGIVYDQELTRELTDEGSSRVFAFTAFLGSKEDASGTELGVGDSDSLGVGNGDSLGVAA